MSTKIPDPKWSPSKDIPDLSGRLAIVTGGTGGLGYQIAVALLSKGAEVIIIGKNEKKGMDAVDRMKQQIAPLEGNINFNPVDFRNLEDVKEYARQFNAKGRCLDLLILNLATFAPQKREVTPDGLFELCFGTNHLSHFAFAGILMESLRRSKHSPRIITHASLGAKMGKIDFDDILYEKIKYDALSCYTRSKLANLSFALELQRRSVANGWGITSIVAHPGVSKTDLGLDVGVKLTLTFILVALMLPFIRMTAEAGSVPAIYAATSPDAEGGGYYGPIGFQETCGNLGNATVPKDAANLEIASKLWEISEEMTGVKWK